MQLARARPPAPRPAAADAAWRGRPRREIRLEGVTYRYPAAAAEALTEVSLCIPAGAIVGLVGDNGSGKSTLLDILTGLLVPQSGRITVDGIAIDAGNRASWQSTLAYVPQQLCLLDATLAENIALGAPIGDGDRERLRRAIAAARLQECVPVSPAAEPGRLGERGARLSGGQRRRVGIARALYRDTSVLIMDEVTAELDSSAERQIIDDIARLAAGRTIILTGHRPSSLRHCDIILELQAGRLAGSTRR